MYQRFYLKIFYQFNNLTHILWQHNIPCKSIKIQIGPIKKETHHFAASISSPLAERLVRDALDAERTAGVGVVVANNAALLSRPRHSQQIRTLSKKSTQHRTLPTRELCCRLLAHSRLAAVTVRWRPAGGTKRPRARQTARQLGRPARSAKIERRDENWANVLASHQNSHWRVVVAAAATPTTYYTVYRSGSQECILLGSAWFQCAWRRGGGWREALHKKVHWSVRVAQTRTMHPTLIVFSRERLCYSIITCSALLSVSFKASSVTMLKIIIRSRRIFTGENLHIHSFPLGLWSGK